MLIKSYLFTLNLSLCSSALNGSFFFFWESKKIRADLISQNLVSGVKIFPGLFSAISWNVERLKQSWKISAAAFWPFRARSLCRLVLGRNSNYIFFNGPTLASFSFIFVFSNTHFKLCNKCVCEKMSIQYMVPGFELTTFGTWVSSHNH